MTIKMIASDMDGTFLNDKGTYDRERFEGILDRLDHHGIRFVVATGNNMARVNLMFDSLLNRLDFVAENGAHLLVEGETINRFILNQTDVDAFLDYFKAQLAAYKVILTGAQHSYMLEAAEWEITNHMIAPEEAKAFVDAIKRVESFEDIPKDETIIKMSVMTGDSVEADAVMADFNTHFTGNLTAVTSGFGTIDIIQTGVHKAAGLQALMERFEILPDELMAFGDSGNDVEMLHLANDSYAVANAPEIIKQHAKYLAPSHTEDGVLEVIESYLDQLESENDR
ncbi:haloacid dehalogenase-like hydrolase [Streptococcus dysgalactiae subsp. equisimilis]|uniref:Haloacid dehalogenase-like hydrolase n=1 Tax=Streptococcus dysgalactiae subsp. equisimilis TaxID=119602 RepID=A0A9X8XH67_STREQ|nr:Cof-type HAD-IIB family hydrolase [Streptococcus dysgalactiae]SUN62376.1 haloacid dehalogenase-like hydrolase [Streptococcus dysgalactiae subsp. equisimilis]